MLDKSAGKEHIGVGALASHREEAKWNPHWTIEKFNGDVHSRQEAEELGLKPFETLEIDGNCLLNAGINQIIWPLVAGSGGTALNSANAYIGVGDSTTAAAATQQGLQAATNKAYQLISGSPTVGSSQQIVFSATFASGAANFAWNEIIVANGNNPPTTGKALNRLVQTMGTKASGTSWVVTLTITLS
jgi:hypothetical protein